MKQGSSMSSTKLQNIKPGLVVHSRSEAVINPMRNGIGAGKSNTLSNNNNKLSSKAIGTKSQSSSLSKSDFQSFIEAQHSKYVSQTSKLQQVVEAVGTSPAPTNEFQQSHAPERVGSVRYPMMMASQQPLPRLTPKNYLINEASETEANTHPKYKGFYSHTPNTFSSGTPVTGQQSEYFSSELRIPSTHKAISTPQIQVEPLNLGDGNSHETGALNNNYMGGGTKRKVGNTSTVQSKGRVLQVPIRPNSSSNSSILANANTITNMNTKTILNTQTIQSKKSGKKAKESANDVLSSLFLGLQHSKVDRNELIEVNHSLREKVVNLERDIKIMSRQVQKWSDESGVHLDVDQQELFLDRNACESIYNDPNFYLVSLQSRVKSMQAEETALIESIRKYGETMRVIRTDVKCEARRVDLEKQFMRAHHEYSELQRSSLRQIEGDQVAMRTNDNDDGERGNSEVDRLGSERDSIQEGIARVREDNKTILVEIQLQNEMFSENQIEIDKLSKKHTLRMKKIAELEAELATKHPHDKLEHKLQEKQIIREKDEQKRNIEANQAKIINQQNETIKALQMEFQEFRNAQIISTQQAVKDETYLMREINTFKEKYLAIKTSVAKKNKILKSEKEVLDRKRKEELLSEQILKMKVVLPTHEAQEEEQDDDANDSRERGGHRGQEEGDDVGDATNKAAAVEENIDDEYDNYMHDEIPTDQELLAGAVPEVNDYGQERRKSPVSELPLDKIKRQSSMNRFHDVPSSRTDTQHQVQTVLETNQTERTQSLRSTFKAIYGDQLGSKYNDDHSLSLIFGVQVID